MDWKRFCLVFLSLVGMICPAGVRAQEVIQSPESAVSGDSDPGFVSEEILDETSFLAPPDGTYLLFNEQTGKAVGIPNSYSRVGVRHAIFENGPQQVFGEVEALITDSNRYGLNTGLGYRQLIDDALWGVNGWYDAIQSDQRFQYQQAGVGFEYLSMPLDLRANGYLPIGNRNNLLSGTVGNGLYQQSLAGFDAEAGIPLPVISWARIYAGVYHLTSTHDGIWGVRSRIEGQLTRGINLSFQVTNDDTFGTNLNVGVDIRFNGRLPTRFGGVNDPYTRRYDPVRRQWQVQLAQNRIP